MSILEVIKQEKEKNGGEYQLVTDLDALVAEERRFKFNGKIFSIKPIDLKTFILFTEAFSQLEAKSEEFKTMGFPEILKIYLSVIQTLCPEFTEEDMKEMNFVQLNALMKFLIEIVAGNKLEKKN